MIWKWRLGDFGKSPTSWCEESSSFGAHTMKAVSVPNTVQVFYLPLRTTIYIHTYIYSNSLLDRK